MAMVTTHIELEELKKGDEQPVDLRETVVRKQRNVSLRKPPVWETVQRVEDNTQENTKKRVFSSKGHGSMQPTSHPEFTAGKIHEERPQGHGPSPPRYPPRGRKNSPTRHNPYRRPKSPCRPRTDKGPA
ncbi:hypothetical protein LIER_36154 [Lithospermum erythrorhizon]|uniref:Uncharacterized protein n=1 Tax=Lithospermum erythrorhizon TaxID=34254 RepID=A0AAV3P1Z8_LITER